MNLRNILNKIKKHIYSSEDALFNKLLKNVVVLFSGDSVASVLRLISLSLAIRLLGVETYGIFVLIKTYVDSIDRLVNFQSWQAVIKYGAEALEEKCEEKFKGILKLSVLLDVSSAILGTLIAITGASLAGKWLGWSSEVIQMARLYSVLITFNLAGAPKGILRLYDKFNLFSIQKLVTAVIELIAVTGAFILKVDLRTFIFIRIITTLSRYLILIGMGLYTLQKNNVHHWWQSRIKEWKEFFKFNVWINLSSTLELPIKQFDKFIVSMVISVEAVAIYDVFKKIGVILSKFSDPVYYAIYPQFASFIANKQDKEAFKMFIKTGLMFLLAGTPVVLLISFSSPWWLGLFFGQVFVENWKLLSFFVTLKFISILFLTIHPLFVAMGFVKKKFVITLIANLSYLVLVWFLGSRLGLMGIIIAFGVQFLIDITLKLIIIKIKLGKQVV